MLFGTRQALFFFSRHFLLWMHIQDKANHSTEISTPFNTFANKAHTDQAALTRAA